MIRRDEVEHLLRGVVERPLDLHNGHGTPFAGKVIRLCLTTTGRSTHSPIDAQPEHEDAKCGRRDVSRLAGVHPIPVAFIDRHDQRKGRLAQRSAVHL